MKSWVGLKRLKGLERLEGSKSKSKSVSLIIPRAADGLDAGIYLGRDSRARKIEGDFQGLSSTCTCILWSILSIIHTSHPPSADDYQPRLLKDDQHLHAWVNLILYLLYLLHTTQVTGFAPQSEQANKQASAQWLVTC